MTRKQSELNQEIERLHEEVSRRVLRKGIRVSVARDEVAVEHGYASWNAMVRTNGKAAEHSDDVTRRYELVVGQKGWTKRPSLEEVLDAMKPRRKARSSWVGQTGRIFHSASEAKRVAAAMLFLNYTGMRVGETSDVTISYLPLLKERPPKAVRILPKTPPKE